MDERRRYQDLSLFRMPAGFRGRSAVMVQLWWIVQATFFGMSPHGLYGWRNFVLRAFGAKIGKGVRIRSTARVTYPWRLTIGDYVWVGDDCVFYSLGEIVLGSHVAIAHDVYFCTGLHDYRKLDFPIGQKPIRIEDEVWIPNDVFIGPGVTIGKGSIVGARSTVLEDLPGGMICYGNPAKPIKAREMQDQVGKAE
jgi:putative colanic acid biosynthesis acetyltransferase WcaF